MSYTWLFVCGCMCVCFRVDQRSTSVVFILLHFNFEGRVSHWVWCSSTWLSCLASKLQQPGYLWSSCPVYRDLFSGYQAPVLAL